MKLSFVLSIVVVTVAFHSTLLTVADEIPSAKPEAVGLSSDKLAKINVAVDQVVKDGKTAGAVVVVIRRGKIAHFSAHGWQDVAQQRPMQQNTIFRIYSMTKPITTAAAMMLWEDGRFKLDDPVSKYLPELKDLWVYAGGGADLYGKEQQAMTVRDLMRHTSGLTYGGGRTPVDQEYREKKFSNRERTLKQFVSELGKMPLKYQPGTRFEYGVSTDVLGRLVEVWSEQTLDKFFQKRIFAPLGMRDSGFAVPDAQIARFATSYGPAEDKGLRVIDAPDTSRYRKQPNMLSGGGGLVSTARDYIRFMQMLLAGGTLDGHRILKADTISLMTKNHIPKKSLPIVQGFPRIGWGFGLGFAVRLEKTDSEPTTPIGECRWGGAASTHFWFLPKEELAVVVMQQHRPFIRILESEIKPIVYAAIVK